MASIRGDPLYDNYVTKFKNRRGIPMAIKLLFFVLAFVFGVDLGFTKCLGKRIRFIAKLISLMMSIFVFFVLSVVLHAKNSDTYWMTINFLSYLLNFLVIKFTNYNVYNFLIDIHRTDSISIKKKSIGVVLWLYLGFLYFSKWVFMYICCEMNYPSLCNFSFLPWYIYSVPVLGLDWMYTVLILMYCYIYLCIKDMYKLYEKDGNIFNLKMRYIEVAQYYDKVRPLYEKMVIVAIMLDLPKTMGLLYNMLKYFVEGGDVLASIGEYIYAFHIISNITSSGAMVQMVVWEVDALTVKLLDDVLVEKDPQRCEDLSRLVEYLQARQLWHPLVGVVPVDMQLPAFMLSVCATYLIVMIQFTHLID